MEENYLILEVKVQNTRNKVLAVKQKARKIYEEGKHGTKQEKNKQMERSNYREINTQAKESERQSQSNIREYTKQ